MPDTATLMAAANLHLRCAAAIAEPDDAALASQIRLAAATLLSAMDDGDNLAYPSGPPDVNLLGHLEQSLNCLDSIPPREGPADLQLCAWHIHELRRIATRQGRR